MPSMFTRLQLLILILTFCGVWSLSAQDMLPEYALDDSITVVGERDGVTSDYASIGTKIALPIREVPLSMGVVTALMIDQQGGEVLGEALQNVAGFNIQPGNGVHDYFIVRGFNSLDNGLILTDGVPEPEATFYHLYNIDRVEALKGPGAFLYGANPLAGTVNLVRKQPTFANFVHGQLSYGSFNTLNAEADLGLVNANQNWSGRFMGMATQSDGFRDRDFSVVAINPSLSWRSGDKHFANINLEFVRNQYTPDPGLPMMLNIATGMYEGLADVDRETNFARTDDFSDQDVLRVKGHYFGRIGKGLTLRNKFYMTEFDWKSESTLLKGAFYDPAVTQQPVVVRRTFSVLDDVQFLVGNQTELQADFKTGQISHQLLLGIEGYRLHDEFLIDFYGGSSLLMNDPSFVVPDPGENLTEYYTKGEGASNVFAPYFLNRVSLLPQAQLMFGGRFDMIRYSDDRQDYRQYFDNQGNFVAGLESSSTERNYNQFSPMVGLVVNPHEAVTLFGNLATAFAPPSTQVPGELDAEESTQFEVGARLQTLEGKVDLSVAYFDLQKENTPLATASGIPNQVGTQEATGVEVEMAIRPGSGVTIHGNFAYTDAKLTKFSELVATGNPLFPLFEQDYSGNRPAFAPEQMASVWLS
ncbi:MAG TPA: TonB-dependent receptor, partial [Calditrichia bacterium]|nr:TonB-dependent receptor [Calditrichia bacterium]